MEKDFSVPCRSHFLGEDVGEALEVYIVEEEEEEEEEVYTVSASYSPL